jgi:hypothetical protein
VLPLCALGLGGAVSAASSRLPLRHAVAVGTAVTVAATALALVETRGHQNNLLELQRESVDAVFSRLPADATVVSEEAPQPLVLTGRVNPTRYQIYGAGLWRYIDDTWPGGIEGYRRWILDQRPTLIAQGDPMDESWIESIKPDYVYVGCAPDFFWYARRDLGAAKIAELRQVATPDYTGAVGDDPCTPPPQ